MRSVFTRARLALLAPMLAGAAVIGVAPATAPVAQAVGGHGILQKVSPQQILPTHNADTTSLNWSGYAALAPAGAKITDVTQHWIVPSVSLLPPGFSSTWAGIGGYNSSDLIQAGTESDTFGGNYAWYEILPDSETPITSGCSGDTTCTVNPGDQMSVTIHSTGGDGWTISMTDAGHWSWSTSLNYPSSFSSAEWILEAPTVGVQSTLANVGTQQFTGVNTFTMNGVTRNIAGGNPVRILLSPGLVNEATPSSLNSTGDRFNSCAWKQSCPTPA